MYKAIALDLDGTLTDSKKRISRENREVLFRAMDMGVKVILASGRPTMGMTAPARELELYSRGGYIVAFNSGEIIDCKSGNALRRVTVPPECIADICDAAHAAGCVPLTYTSDMIVTENEDDKYVQREKICVNAEIMAVPDLRTFVTYDTPKFLIVGEHEKLTAAERILKKRHSDKLNIFYSESYFLEVCPVGVAKDTGLKELCDQLDILPEELMACGDGLNDMPMLKFAGLGVAMANSCAEVLAVADYVTLSNDKNGVAAAVEKFILGSED